jgi:catechol 2,3-dioxygenase-like lactoylglutathione lyase family enzyme
MDIKIVSIFVEDQSKALAFYTKLLGFRRVNDIDLGEFRWLTVSSDGSGETELVLEPSAHPASRACQEAIYADGIPATLFHSEDIQEEYKRLTAKGVSLKDKPLENSAARNARRGL